MSSCKEKIRLRDQEIARLVTHAEFLEWQLMQRNHQLVEDLVTAAGAQLQHSPSHQPPVPPTPHNDGGTDDSNDDDNVDDDGRQGSGGGNGHGEWFSEKKRE